MGFTPGDYDRLPHDTNLNIDPGQHRRLAMHVVEYAHRNDLSPEETFDLVSMIGL